MGQYRSTLPTLTDGQTNAELVDSKGRALVAAVQYTSGGDEVIGSAGEYEAVAASQTDQIMGATGAVGDWLERVICTVATAATSTVSIKDGNGSSIPLLAANTPIGTYSIQVGMKAINGTTPGWKITTGAGVSAIGIGNFT